MSIRRALTSVVCTALAGCLGNPSPATEQSAPVPAESRQDYVITARELEDPSIASQNLLDAVRRLRPHFLASRGVISLKNPNAGKVHVSIDGGALADVSTMSSYMPSSIAEVRYLSASEAAQRFGVLANAGSVIVVKSK